MPRPPLSPSEKRKTHGIRLSPAEHAYLAHLGDGNISKGIRITIALAQSLGESLRHKKTPKANAPGAPTTTKGSIPC